MSKEAELTQVELESLACSLARTFIQRRDLYAQQRDDGRYICIREPLTDTHLIAHLRGDITLGAYVLTSASQARFVVVDADDDQTLAQMHKIGQWLSEAGVPVYRERSRRGGHLWLFLGRELPGEEVRRFGTGLLAYHDLEGVELFPKQNRLLSGPGSLIRLPFGVHRKSGRRYGFFLPNGRPLAATLREQIQILATPPHPSPIPCWTARRWLIWRCAMG